MGSETPLEPIDYNCIQMVLKQYEVVKDDRIKIFGKSEFFSKISSLCSAEKGKSYRFGTTPIILCSLKRFGVNFG